MKKVTIYFKSGNILKLKCKKFRMYLDGNSRNLEIETSSNILGHMVDLSEIEAYTVKKCLF